MSTKMALIGFYIMVAPAILIGGEVRQKKDDPVVSNTSIHYRLPRTMKGTKFDPSFFEEALRDANKTLRTFLSFQGCRKVELFQDSNVGMLSAEGKILGSAVCESPTVISGYVDYLTFKTGNSWHVIRIARYPNDDIKKICEMMDRDFVEIWEKNLEIFDLDIKPNQSVVSMQELCFRIPIFEFKVVSASVFKQSKKDGF